MTRIDPDLLSRYYDGELSGEEAEVVRRALADSPAAAAQLERWDEVGDALHVWAEQRASHHADVAQAVMDRISRPQLRVIVGGRANANATETQHAEVSTSRLARYFNARAAAAGFLAAAAAACLVLMQSAPSPEQIPAARRLVAQAVSTAAAQVGLAKPAISETPAVAEFADAPVGSAIETVEFGTHTGSIFMVTAGPTSTPVVWLTDEPQAARVESL